MRHLERRLRRLSLRAPSQELDACILSLKSERSSLAARTGRRVPLWSAVAASGLMGCVGFGVGTVCQVKWATRSVESRPPIVVEIVCDSPSGTNPFDFTSPAAGFPDEKWEGRVITHVQSST
jgi:hypothetical protein